MSSSSRPRSGSERPCRSVLRILLLLVGGVVLLTAMAAISGCCDRFFYYPDSIRYSEPSEYGLAFEPVSFRSKDGTRLSGWFLPAAGRARGTVVHCHGNAQNMTSHWLFAQFLPEHGFNLFVFDYRGYGRSEGRPSRAGTAEDARAAVEYVLGRPDVDPGRVGLFGQSLGGAIAIVVAAEDERVKGVIVDSGFSSYRTQAAHALRSNPVTWLLSWPLSRLLIRSGLDPIDHVANIAPRPLLIIHGTLDRIVPVAMGRELYEKAGEPKELWLVEGTHHTAAVQQQPEEFRKRVCALFERAFSAP